MRKIFEIVFPVMWIGFGVGLWFCSSDIDPSYRVPLLGFIMLAVSFVITVMLDSDKNNNKY